MYYNMTLAELLKQTELKSDEDFNKFNQLRKQAFEVANRIFDDRAATYNFSYHSVEEQPFGVVSLASELFKRGKRMTGIMTPLRTTPLEAADVNRAIDLCIDLMNYASWQYAMLKRAFPEGGNDKCSDAPNYEKEVTPRVRE